MSDPLRFLAEIIKVQTMADNAIRLTLEMAESETVLMAKLAECRRLGALLRIEAKAEIPSKADNNDYGL